MITENEKQAKEVAETFLKQYGLFAEGWRFVFGRNNFHRLGCCNYTRKQISVARNLINLNSIDISKNTIIHELAHAICWVENKSNCGHSDIWRKKCIELGIAPNRTTDCEAENINLGKSKYTYICPNCKIESQRQKIATREFACANCCKKYTNNKFDKGLVMVLSVKNL